MRVFHEGQSKTQGGIVSDWEMVAEYDWFKVGRKKLPNKNSRLNELVISLPESGYEIRSPMTVAIDTCIQVSRKFAGPYTLLVSGGVDSQAMMLAWKYSGIPFKAVHYRYGQYNNEDTTSLLQFALIQNIPIEIRSFDVIKYINSTQYIDDAIKFDCVSPHILTYMKFISNHAETCVLSGNFILSGNAGLNWTILGLHRYRLLEKPNLVPFFFFDNPHIASMFAGSEYTDPDAHLNKRVNGDAWYSQKCDILKRAGFDVIPQRTKLTGFECIKSFYDDSTVPGRTRIKYSNMPSKRPFDLLYRYSLFDHLLLGRYSDITDLR